MRLVLDTNVIVAGLRSRNGASNLVLRYGLTGRFVPLCSTALFLEYEAVFKRGAIRSVTRMSQEDIDIFLSAWASVCEPVDVLFRTRPVLSDADDEMVLEAAVNGGGSVVSHNVRDFAAARKLGVEILTPGTILERMKHG